MVLGLDRSYEKRHDQVMGALSETHSAILVVNRGWVQQQIVVGVCPAGIARRANSPQVLGCD
jgi:hypothetical protein